MRAQIDLHRIGYRVDNLLAEDQVREIGLLAFGHQRWCTFTGGRKRLPRKLS